MLDVRDLAVSYGLARALFGINLTASQGEVVCLLGRNGAGKSTTLNTIMGFLRPDGGSVSWGGHELIGLPPYEISALGVGYVPENRRLFATLTVAENLQVGRRPGGLWDLEAVLGLFPRLRELSNRKAGTLSGGEQQMLAMARTLMGSPRLLLLDEPTAGLAPLILESMAAQIRSFKEHGITTLLSEQNVRFASTVADRVVILDRGQVVYEGTYQELEAEAEIKTKYLAV
ncbi:MAG TPA: ABC transporter ATP-binding protein [Anaerolineales bacterium]|jgi:branched-chain amino acid transport system ATP-binding protein